MRRSNPRVSASAGGQPSWLMTFADLMTLLLTFFILLLGFSEMDVEKYRAMATAMSQAFGVSFVPTSRRLPDAASLPAPSTVVATGPSATAAIEDGTGPAVAAATTTGAAPSAATASDAAAQFAEHEDLAGVLIATLEEQIDAGDVSVQYDAEEVLLSFSERATFGSGSDALQPSVRVVLGKVVRVLQACRSSILVAGHSDERPVTSGRFRSNWDLSASRAVSVVHELVLDGSLDPRRVAAVGHAETHPLVPNDSDENRALNRRVEIHVQGAECRLDRL